MLEKLGEILKKATDKIANAIFLDKNLVDSIVKDLQRALIEADVNIALVKSQNRIMFLGLYGAGKTTTIAKLGNYYSKRGHKVILLGIDVHRPAASEQLRQMAEK